MFDKYIAHRLKREAKVLGALRSSPSTGATLAELLPIAYDDTPLFLWPIASLSLQAHLEKLIRDGKAKEASGKETRYVVVSGA